MSSSVVADWGIPHRNVIHNAPPAVLYENALRRDGALLTASGALAARSGIRTGRSPKDKRIVKDGPSQDFIWWGPVNMPLRPEAYAALRQAAVDALATPPELYVVDGFAGWDPRYRLKIRVISARPYHALFMHNMLIRPTPEELVSFGAPDYVIFNAGQKSAPKDIEGVTPPTSVTLNLERREVVILGTEYAGEMKKAVFTVMNYVMPRQGVLSMHCSANEGDRGDVTLFFGLSGTGKTTLSADPRRHLIGDDEHCWSDAGVFNIEGGCYAKCIGLAPEKEPQIYSAIRFGALLENVVVDLHTREVDYANASITENTRASYTVEHMPYAKIPCVGGHPRNIILLTCDAFGVLPPVSRLTTEQAMYHFINGYTAKVAGTEMGVTEPQATFSACFGAAFLALHPREYARMLADRMNQHAAQAWLINTGWTGGPYGEGSRIPLSATRAIIDAIHSGELAEVRTETEPFFGLHIPAECPGCPTEILRPRGTWRDPVRYDAAASRLAEMFAANYAQYADGESTGANALREPT